MNNVALVKKSKIWFFYRSLFFLIFLSLQTPSIAFPIESLVISSKPFESHFSNRIFIVGFHFDHTFDMFSIDCSICHRGNCVHVDLRVNGKR